MLVSPGTASPNPTPAAADVAALLEALAEAGDALTAGLLAHDLAAITAATAQAEALVGRLDAVASRGAARRLPDALAPVAERIGAAARRNAVLLESAWTTDAEMLRLLAAAATDADGAAPAYGPPAGGQAPAGWLDRSA